MISRIGLADYFERRGNQFRTYQDKLVDYARISACKLWSYYPDWIVNAPTPGTSFARGYMNNLCADIPSPPLPPPPAAIPPAQCDTGYFVYGRYISLQTSKCGQEAKWMNCQPINPTQISSWQPESINGKWGWILNTGQFVAARGITDAMYANEMANYSCPSGGIADRDPQAGCINITFPLYGYQFTPEKWRREDNLPDECGNANYPPTFPPPDIEDEYDYPGEDGDDLPVKIRPKFPLAFPLVLVVNDIDVTFDFDGITFDFGGNDKLPDGQPNPLPTPIPRGNPFRNRSPFIWNPGGALVVKDEYEEVVKEPPPAAVEQQEDLEELVGDELRYVIFEVTSVPSNQPKAAASPGHPLIFCGWMQFTADGYNFPRTKIEWHNSIFEAPEGSTGYRYTLYIGIKARIKIYKLKE